ncbi:MAG: hypothetical protein ABI472_10075 [Ginsengibacter sp.]
MKIIVTAIFASFVFSPPKATIEKWLIEKSSNLSIQGKSNVADFRCDIVEYLRPDTLQIYKDDEQERFFRVKGGLTINVNCFDCHQKYITGDLRKALKADEIPLLKIELLSLGNFGNTANKNITGVVTITLAGVIKKMEVNYIVQTGNDGTLHLTGSRQVLFSDFGLTPPHKLAGLIKVEEQIEVRFQLILRPV